MIRKRIPRQRIIAAALIILAALFILVFYLRHLTETTRLGLVLRDVELRLNRLRDEVRALEAKKAALLSLPRVERVAREELKLSEPRPGQVIYEPTPEPNK